VIQWNDRTKGVVLFALALLIYGFGIGRRFMFDDQVYISENPLLRRHDALHAAWFTTEAFNYYPLFWSLLHAQWLLWGDHPLGYHLVNLLVHCANAVLVWRICRAWHLPGSWWVGALFAVHPINVQTLAWAAEQKNTWSFLLMALAALAFVRHAGRGELRAYVLSLVCFLAALACKTSAVALPVFLALVYGYRRENRRWLLLRLTPFFGAAVAAGVTTIWFEAHRVGAKSLIATLPLWERMEAAGAAFWFYVWKALLPVDLTPMYEGWVDTTAAAHTASAGVLLALLVTALAFTWRRVGAPVALGVICYLLMLLPLLGIFDTNYFAYSHIADHWQYHALPGLLVTCAAVARLLAQQVPNLARLNLAGGSVAVAALAILASTHFAHFEDAESLWSYVVKRNPQAWIAWYNLGNEHASKRDHVHAATAYRESIRIKGDYYRARFNLAYSLAASDQLEQASIAYLEARRLAPDEPDNYVNRGVVLLRLQREDEAIAEFQRALELDPLKTSAHANLMSIYRQSPAVAAAALAPAPAAH
jgi:protein O-mannosyl-transferase